MLPRASVYLLVLPIPSSCFHLPPRFLYPCTSFHLRPSTSNNLLFLPSTSTRSIYSYFHILLSTSVASLYSRILGSTFLTSMYFHLRPHITLLFTFINFHQLSYTSIYFRLLPYASVSFHTLPSTSVHLHILPPSSM